MSTCTDPRRLLVALAVTFLLAGCAASASPTPVPVTPTPIVTPAAATANRTNVSGSMEGELYKEDEATSRLYFEWTHTTSDPRVSGTEKIDCTERFFDLPDLGYGAGVGLFWECSMVLTAQGGTWKGVTGYGSEYRVDDQLRIIGTRIYEGQGAFAGLRYVSLFTSSPEMHAIAGGEYAIAGWIEPAK